MLLSLAVCASLYSCEATDDSAAQGSLTIEVDTQSISLDDDEAATFTVLLGSKDVTAESQIINITDGGYTALDSNVFSTLRPGTHTFFAIYGEQNSDRVGVNAISSSNLSSTYYRRNILMKFTATWCTYCPTMTTSIEAAMKEYPDRLIEVAVHSSDDLETGTSASYVSQFGVLNLPWAIVDMNNSYFGSDDTINSLTMIEAAKQSMIDYPTVCGIALETSCVDDVLTVDVEASFVADGKYKMLAWILQSGYNYDQSGTNDTSYTQDHVIFTCLSEDATGDLLGELIVNERVEKTFTFDYSELLTAGYEFDSYDDVEIVVCILKEEGASYYVNNATSAGVNESVPYQFEMNTDEE